MSTFHDKNIYGIQPSLCNILFIIYILQCRDFVFFNKIEQRF